MLVLRVVREGELYGYEIAQRIRASTNATLSPSEGALYPTLHRLEAEGSLEAEWREGLHGPRRRYYKLTAHGAGRLAAYEREWTSLQSALRATVSREATSG